MLCDIYMELEELENCKPLARGDITHSDWLPDVLCQNKADDCGNCCSSDDSIVSVLTGSFDVYTVSDGLSCAEFEATPSGLGHKIFNALRGKKRGVRDKTTDCTDIVINDVGCETGSRFRRLISGTRDNLKLLLSTKDINETSLHAMSTTIPISFKSPAGGSSTTNCFLDMSGEVGVSSSLMGSAENLDIFSSLCLVDCNNKHANKIFLETQKNIGSNEKMNVSSSSNNNNNKTANNFNNSVSDVDSNKSASQSPLSSGELSECVLSRDEGGVEATNSSLCQLKKGNGVSKCSGTIDGTHNSSSNNTGNVIKAKVQEANYIKPCDHICDLLTLPEIELTMTPSCSPRLNVVNTQQNVFSIDAKEAQKGGKNDDEFPPLSASTSAVVILDVYEVSDGQLPTQLTQSSEKAKNNSGKPTTPLKTTNDKSLIQSDMTQGLIPKVIPPVVTEDKTNDVLLPDDSSLVFVREADKKKKKCPLTKQMERKKNEVKENGGPLADCGGVLRKNMREEENNTSAARKKRQVKFIENNKNNKNENDGEKMAHARPISPSILVMRKRKETSSQHNELTAFSKKEKEEGGIKEEGGVVRFGTYCCFVSKNMKVEARKKCCSVM